MEILLIFYKVRPENHASFTKTEFVLIWRFLLYQGEICQSTRAL